MAEACVAVEKFEASTRVGMQRKSREIARSLVMRALGDGMSTSTDVMRCDDPRIGAREHAELRALIEWFGTQTENAAA